VKKAAAKKPAPKAISKSASPKKAAKRVARAKGSAAKALGRRHADQGDTRATLLRAATEEFARDGYEGARIDRISARAGANDRMIYYYFGGKQQLFIEVLEAVYAELGAAEAALDLDMEQPARALEAVVRFTLAYYRDHLEMIALLNNENQRGGASVAQSRKVKSLSSPLTSLLDRILAAGVKQGLFRAGVSSRDLYIAIAALPYFYLSNRHTLSRFLGTDLMRPAQLAHWSDFSVDMVLRMVSAEGVAASRSTPSAAQKKPRAPGRTSG
jgi:AcrR family transcriptional regulator